MMDKTHYCTSCGALLQPDDGHDHCPMCLGLEHLKEALSENPCMNCSYMPRAVRAARLAEREYPEGEGDLPPSGQASPPQHRHSKHRAEATAAAPSRKKTKSGQGRVSSKVDQLSAELAQMRSMLRTHNPAVPSEEDEVLTPPMPELVPEDDALSLAASAIHFHD
ncbi:hypothetical protein ABVT39_000563 [Epinephelus coioides]